MARFIIIFGSIIAKIILNLAIGIDTLGRNMLSYMRQTEEL